MRLRFAVVVCASAVAASGCAGSSSGPAAGPETTDRLMVALPLPVGPLNIFVEHEEWISELVYDKLVAPSPFVEDPQPWLASDVEMIDGSTWAHRAGSYGGFAESPADRIVHKWSLIPRDTAVAANALVTS